MKFFVKKTLSGLIPSSRSEFDKMQECKLKLGEYYEVEIKKKRNYQFHKKLFALIAITFENQEQFQLQDDLREYLTIKAGFYRKVLMPNGYEQIKPKSISFSNMDEVEFNELYDRFVSQVLLFLGCDNDDLMEQLKEF